MKERPILFTGEMVRAILDGRKTQTRRLVKPQPVFVASPWVPFRTPDADPKGIIKSPFGEAGYRLWVRETHCKLLSGDIWYRADGHSVCDGLWTPSIHMPRWASRIDLEITAVRVERVQDITEEDAKKEGVNWKSHVVDEASGNLEPYEEASDAFKHLWQSIYGNRPTLPKNPESKRYHRVKRWLDRNPPTGWDANPWVWVYEFRRIKP